MAQKGRLVNAAQTSTARPRGAPQYCELKKARIWARPSSMAMSVASLSTLSRIFLPDRESMRTVTSRRVHEMIDRSKKQEGNDRMKLRLGRTYITCAGCT